MNQREQKQEYDRKRYTLIKERILQHNHTWAEQNRDKMVVYVQRWMKKYPEKRKAQTAAQHNIKEHQPCEVCGAEKAEKHHDDYSKPLDVRFLCRKHHTEVHRNLRLQEQAANKRLSEVQVTLL